MKKSNDTIGNRTRDLPACSAVPEPTALPRAPFVRYTSIKFHENLSSGSRVVLCGKTDRQTYEWTGRQTDTAKLNKRILHFVDLACFYKLVSTNLVHKFLVSFRPSYQTFTYIE